MSRISQAQLTDHIGLVQWQEPPELPQFNLLTVHSLLLDTHPRFMELKATVEEYNKQTSRDKKQAKIRLKLISQLYRMLCEVIRIPVYEQQVRYLGKVYHWMRHARSEDEQTEQKDFSQQRPTTASTRSRPFSAATKVHRPQSGHHTAHHTAHHMNNKTPTQLEIEVDMSRERGNIDYDRLRPSDRGYFTGSRTIHEAYAEPRRRLKEYQRKVFYDEERQSDEELPCDRPSHHIQPLSGLPLQQFLPQVVEIEAQPENAEGDLGADGQGAEGQLEEEVNIDDIPIEGEDLEEQQVQEADKLRPKVRPYADYQHEDTFQTKIGVQEAIFKQSAIRNQLERMENQDVNIAKMQVEWAKEKSRIKNQMKRRAQSARIVREKLGSIGVSLRSKVPETKIQRYATIEPVAPIQVNCLKGRPQTASMLHKSNNVLKNAFLTGKLAQFNPNPNQSNPNQSNPNRSNPNQPNPNQSSQIIAEVPLKMPPHPNFSNPLSLISTLSPDPATMSLRTAVAPQKFSVVAPQPKRRGFAQILQEAEERVQREAAEEVMQVKEMLTKGKLAVGANRIAKSVTYYEREMPDIFVGDITGMSLPRNPFMKVAKKKKTKKRK